MPFKIDYLTKLSGTNFEDAWESAIDSNLDGVPLRFIHLNHLILAKMASGRQKDKLDIEELQKIAQLKKGL
jgi:predicted nucleotidyltransferase